MVETVEIVEADLHGFHSFPDFLPFGEAFRVKS